MTYSATLTLQYVAANEWPRWAALVAYVVRFYENVRVVNIELKEDKNLTIKPKYRLSGGDFLLRCQVDIIVGFLIIVHRMHMHAHTQNNYIA